MRHSLVILVLLLLAGPAFTQEKSWVGKTILVKKDGIKIGKTGDDGKQVYLATLDGISYAVLAEDNGWLKVNDGRGNIGWFDKADAVLLDNAVDHFSGRIRQNPKDALAYSYRGWAWKLRGDLDKAIKDFDDAMRFDPKPYIYQNRAAAWHAKKDYDKAIADYSEAIRLDPKTPSTYINRGIAWSDKKEHEKALGDFNEAIRLNPKDVFAYNNRGMVWEKKKEFAKAIADYAEAIRLDPSDGEGYNNMAWVLATAPEPKVRNGKRAVELAKKALELDKSNTGWLDTLAAAYAEAGNFDEAIRWQERVLADPQFKDDADTRARLEMYRKKQPYRQD